MTVTLLTCAWLLLAYTPWIANERRASVFIMLLLLDNLVAVIHGLGHRWGAARYGIGLPWDLLPLFHLARLGFDESGPKARYSTLVTGSVLNVWSAVAGLAFLFASDHRSVSYYVDGVLLANPTGTKHFALNDAVLLFTYLSMLKALFHLLPSLQLDGGRILLAKWEEVMSHVDAFVLWRRTAATLGLIVIAAGIVGLILLPNAEALKPLVMWAMAALPIGLHLISSLTEIDSPDWSKSHT